MLPDGDSPIVGQPFRPPVGWVEIPNSEIRNSKFEIYFRSFNLFGPAASTSAEHPAA